MVVGDYASSPGPFFPPHHNTAHGSRESLSGKARSDSASLVKDPAQDSNNPKGTTNKPFSGTKASEPL